MTKVLVNFVQDRSGSMQSVWDETLNGFRAFVKDLKEKGAKDGVEYVFSLTAFDTLVDKPCLGKQISDVDGDLLAHYPPRGGTALYDAVGAAIADTDADRHGADKIMVVVVTDGQENSSREWTKDRLHKAVEERLLKGDWTFVYLGTQPETWADANAVGIGAGATAQYDAQHAHKTYRATSAGVHAMARSACAGTRNFVQDFMDPNKAPGLQVRPGAQPPRTRPQTRPPSPPPSRHTGSTPPQRWR